MADIKKFTGYIAPDGSTHETIKKATDYTRNLKIKEAVSALSRKLFDQAHVAAEAGVRTAGFCDMDNSDSYNPGVTDHEELTSLLMENRDAITAAFNPEVNLRKPRAPRVPKAPPPADGLGAS